MNSLTSPRDDLLQRLEPLPLCCRASVSRTGGGWIICIAASYGGFEWLEHEYLPDTMLAWVSAIRDKLLTRHYRRAREIIEQPYEVGAVYWQFFPYSKMEQLNHASF